MSHDNVAPAVSNARPYGLVLGGGGARGLAHIGVWRVLEREHLLPSVLAGTSMGGLVAAFIAAGYSAGDLESIASSVAWHRLLDLRLGTSLFSDAAFTTWLAQHLPATFEELSLPLAVTATDILSGRGVYLSRGNLHAALRATVAYPGAVDPLPYQDMLLLDGGILNQVPVDAALFLGAPQVLAVDVTTPQHLELPAVSSRLTPPAWLKLGRWRGAWPAAALSPAAPAVHLGTVQTLRRAVDIMQAQLTDARLSLYRPDVLLRPELRGVDLQSFRRGPQAILAGEAAAMAELERLRQTFG